MGSSPSIQQQGQKDKAFNEYVKEQSTVLEAKLGEAEKRMNDRMEAFYKAGGWTDAKPLTQGSYSHLTTASEWSLTHVTDMITAIRGAIFGGTAPPAAGVNEQPPQPGKGATIETPNAALTAMAAMEGMDLLIADAAFQAIQGILTTFTSKTSTEIASDYVQKDLIPGLSLFVTVMENMYHRSDFFTGETIIQNFYIFDARFSVSRGADIAKFSVLESLMDEQRAFEANAGGLGTEIGELNVKDSEFETKFTKLTKMLEIVNTQVEVMQKKIDALRAARNAANAARIAELRDSARAS
jgi:hypothetical protein